MGNLYELIEAPPSTCPICNLPAARSVARNLDGISTSNYLCPLDHPWSMRWLTKEK